MQDDISDGVQWLIKEGIAAPSRIGIYGASYGRLRHLAGLTSLRTCMPRHRLRRSVEHLHSCWKRCRPYWELGRQMMYEMVGDRLKDRGAPEAGVADLSCRQIRAPLLVAQGANDPRSRGRIGPDRAALRQRGVSVEYLVKDNEGSGFHNERTALTSTAGWKAPGRHLGSRAESPPPV